MNLLYKSTRNAEHTATASEAILKGLGGRWGIVCAGADPEAGCDDGRTEDDVLSGDRLCG